MTSRRQAATGQNGQQGAATVELLVLVLPLLLLVVTVVVAVGRLVTTRTALSGVTRDAARSAVTATSAAQAVQLGTQQAQRTAASYGLETSRLILTVEPGAFTRGGTVTVTASYQLALIPALDTGPTVVVLTDAHAELIDPYRSR